MATNKATKAANHIKYVSEKKHFPVKILNYLQNNGDSNYDYDSVVKKIQELIVNGVTDQSYKIINPVNEVSPLMMKLRFVRSNSNDFDCQPSQFNSFNVTTPIVSEATTPISNTAATLKHHSDDVETHIKSLEDKLLSKIAALKSHLFNDIFDLRNDITLLNEHNEKEKPANS